MATKKNQEAEVAQTDTPIEGTENGQPKRSKEEIEKEIEDAKKKIAALKAEAKGEKPKKEKVIKGKPVAFYNQKGELITGMGVQYYVARHNKRLHYKEASQVAFLPDTWKEGDPVPADIEVPGKPVEESLA